MTILYFQLMTSYAVVLAPEGAKDGLSRLMRTLKLKSTQIKRILLNLRKRKPDIQMTMRMSINHMIPNTDTRAVDVPGFLVGGTNVVGTNSWSGYERIRTLGY